MLRQTICECGILRGTPASDPRITAFKGIPFAAPPIGKLRWRSPQPAKKWKGVRKCMHFGPASMQETPGKEGGFYDREWHVDSEILMSEDCLYLNIWTPANNVEERLPVMVWLFGGGMTSGYTEEMEFDGERIARRGIVLVSVNYRLNAFGFLAHKELTVEAKKRGEVATNFGLMDQQAAIRWIKRNVETFGGDPNNITLFGQSAGGRSTWMQIIASSNKGLFQKAIVQSGALEGGIALYPDLDEAENRGEQFLEFLGVQNITEARAISAVTLRDKALDFNRHRWGPVIDGCFLATTPMKAFANHLENDVSIMAGNTVDEVRGLRPSDTVMGFREKMQLIYGDDWCKFDSLTGIETEQDLQAYYKSQAFSIFEIGNNYAATKRLEHGGKPFYLYRFSPNIPGDDAGSFHSSDLWFVFETLSKSWRPFTGVHYDLSRRMCNYWTNFARTGNPNGNDNDGRPMPYWQPVHHGLRNVMHLAEEQFLVCEPENILLNYELERMDRMNND